MLEELGLPYEYRLIDLKRGQHRTDSFLALNSAGKVPLLETDHGVLLESGAIINYLASLKPDAELIPGGSAWRRAQYDQWQCFALTELEQPLWSITRHTFVLPETQRIAQIIPLAQEEFQRALGCLAQGLGDRAYMLGDRFCALDILVAHTLFWAMAYQQPIEYRNVTDYIGRMAVRPALGAAREREKAA
jgi:glutathione S-transferase